MNSLHLIEVPRPDQNTRWISQEFGIRKRKEFLRYENYTVIEKVQDFFSTQLHGADYTLSSAKKRLDSKLHPIQFAQFDDKTPIGKTDKVEKMGLAILFHGLNGQANLWDEHVALFKKHPEVDVLAPEVPDEGHQSLFDTTTTALLGRIVDWTKDNPGKPIALFGQSNGTRFALLFEILLRENAPKSPVHVSLTSGVLYGTILIQIANATCSFNLVSPINRKELALGSPTPKELVGEARKPLPEGVAERDYVMYAPKHDVLVPNTGSALPILVCDGQKLKKEKHYLVTNYGHNALVKGLDLSQKQIADCISWMKIQNNG